MSVCLKAEKSSFHSDPMLPFSWSITDKVKENVKLRVEIIKYSNIAFSVALYSFV